MAAVLSQNPTQGYPVSLGLSPCPTSPYGSRSSLVSGICCLSVILDDASTNCKGLSKCTRLRHIGMATSINNFHTLPSSCTPMYLSYGSCGADGRNDHAGILRYGTQLLPRSITWKNGSRAWITNGHSEFQQGLFWIHEQLLYISKQLKLR